MSVGASAAAYHAVTHGKSGLKLTPHGEHLALDDAEQRHLSADGLTITTEEEEEFPNMVFVPIKDTPADVDRRELLIFLIMLVFFVYNLGSQHFADDLEVNTGIKSVVDVTAFSKIETIDAYLAWWPTFAAALHEWHQNARLAQGLSVGAENTTSSWSEDGAGRVNKIEDLAATRSALLVGSPQILQSRCATAGACKGLGQEAQMVPPFASFDAYEQPCPWEPELGQGGTLACYVTTRPGKDGPMFVLPHTDKILSGQISWTPTNWLSRYDTVRVQHSFVLYIPDTQRFAMGELSLYMSATGKVVPKVEFSTYEPYLLETHPFAFGIEFVFYAIILYFVVCELFEIWDCICASELLIPFEIVSGMLNLRLHEIEYYHERSSEVYDPRDPNTGEVFVFPDKEDLLDHMISVIVPTQNSLKESVEKLNDLKIKIASDKFVSESKKKSKQLSDMHDAIKKLILEIAEKEAVLTHELNVAEMAAVLQMAVMWKNKWNADFDGSYLAEVANNPEVTEDDFAAVEWVSVARAYIQWTINFKGGKTYEDDDRLIDTVSDDPTSAGRSMVSPRGVPLKQPPGLKLETKNLSRLERPQSISNSLKTAVSRKDAARPRSPKVDEMAQKARFEELSGFVDFLKMLRDATKLHDDLTFARRLKHWSGPRGATSMSGSVAHAFQKQILTYNKTGRALREEMEIFPQEIEMGFVESNVTKAAMIHTHAINQQERLHDLLDICGVLGFYFPGSPLWERRRKLRTAGKIRRSDAFFETFRSADWGIVSSTSMKMYRSQTGVSEVDNPVCERETPRDFDLFDASGGDDSAPEDEEDSIDINSRYTDRPTPGWRRLIPPSAKGLVTWDGQFVFPEDSPVGEKMLKRSSLYPLILWLRMGLNVYLRDPWNMMEFVSYILFLLAAYYKIKMFQLADSLTDEYESILRGEETEMGVALSQYVLTETVYTMTMIPNSMFMFAKIFKYIDVVPQLGLLLMVMQKALGPVLIFSLVAMVPVFGISSSFHVAFGAESQNYNSISSSLNTVMRMSVGDFDFNEIYMAKPRTAIFLFWTSSLILVFVLTNIFIAIILGAYQEVVDNNKEATDVSDFAATCMMQVKKTTAEAIVSGDDNEEGADEEEEEEQEEPHVMKTRMDTIDEEDYWDSFEQYFAIGGPAGTGTTPRAGPANSSEPEPLIARSRGGGGNDTSSAGSSNDYDVATRMDTIEKKLNQVLELISNGSSYR